MNRQKAIEIITGLYRVPVENGTDEFAAEINKAIDMAIEALSAERTGEWIPVSVRLPEEYAQYLCYCEDGDCYVYWLDNEPWAEETVEKERIIAWMPLPEPFKGE